MKDKGHLTPEGPSQLSTEAMTKYGKHEPVIGLSFVEWPDLIPMNGFPY